MLIRFSPREKSGAALSRVRTRKGMIRSMEINKNDICVTVQYCLSAIKRMLSMRIALLLNVDD